MRKLLPIIICTFCLSVPVTVQAEQNVTNQLEEIIGQLDNLDQVIQFFVDNQENLQMLVDSDLWNDHLQGALGQMFGVLNQINGRLGGFVRLDLESIKNDVDAMASDVAALSADVAVFVSQIVASINGVTSELVTFQSSLYQQLDFVRFLLTKPQLDESLLEFINQLDNNSSMLQNYSSTLNQILQAIQSMDYHYQVEDALRNIATALDQMGNIVVNIDLVEELENMDLHFDLDLGTALSRLEGDLGSVLSTLDHISYLFQVYINLFAEFKNDQVLTNQKLRDFAYWYQFTFFPGLQQHIIMQNQWLLRQEARETAESEYRDDLEQFLTYDAEMPTDSDVPYVAQLEQAGLEEPEMPDEKIYSAVDSVETDLEDVELELTGALDLVDTEFKGLLNQLNLRWGSFNPILSFSFNPKLKGSNFSMDFRYDFSKSELLPPCKAASTGVWGIILFVESFLAITATFGHLIEN